MSESPQDIPQESPPASVEAIRRRVSYHRWRVYEAVGSVLEQLTRTVDWEQVYDCDAPLATYSDWGLFLENLIPEAAARIRSVHEEEVPPDAVEEAAPEELEDHLYWGTKQIESGMQQSLAVLSREMVASLTRNEAEMEPAELLAYKRALCMPIAEVAGKLRSDLRRFAAFVVASDRWDSNEVELILFPQRSRELEKSRSLKDRLVDTMESFQGSDERLPIADVLRMWRAGQVLGPAALAEVDMLIGSLQRMLVADDRKALYADSYYRLVDWVQRLVECSAGLKERLGDEEIEQQLIKEIAAVLDAEILADLLGEEWLGDPDEGAIPDVSDLLEPLTRRELSKVDLPRPQRRRVQELREALREGASLGTVLDTRDVDMVRTAASKIRGQRQVDALRLKTLPENLEHLEHLHPIVQSAEDGVKTYLMLLYGQIQNRDLHLLKVDEKAMSMAEKRLAVLEMRHQLSRISDTRRYEAFETVRAALAAGEEIDSETWERTLRFLMLLSREVRPRVKRLAAFTEGLPEDSAARIAAAINEIEALEEMPSSGDRPRIAEALETLAGILSEVQNIEVAIAPPETEAELEDFLNMLG